MWLPKLVMDRNNFNFVRASLALMVVFAHLAALTKLKEFEIFQIIFDANFAVKGFFAISGYLVAHSYLSSISLFDFFEKRARRLYPAYFTAILFCFCIGISSTTLNLFDFLIVLLIVISFAELMSWYAWLLGLLDLKIFQLYGYIVYYLNWWHLQF